MKLTIRDNHRKLKTKKNLRKEFRHVWCGNRLPHGIFTTTNLLLITINILSRKIQRNDQNAFTVQISEVTRNLCSIIWIDNINLLIFFFSFFIQQRIALMKKIIIYHSAILEL